MLEEKVRPYMQNIDDSALSRPILMQPQNENKNKNQKVFLHFWATLLFFFKLVVGVGSMAGC